MATFARSTFGYAGYAAARPSYSQSLYNLIFAYHKGRYDHCVDLGTGHGVVARALSPRFTSITAIDPSDGMLSQAASLTPRATYSNISYAAGPAESATNIVGDDAADMIVSAQAAHWFDYNRAWPDLGKALKKGGTIAFWCYSELHFPEYEKITQILLRFMLGEPDGDDAKPTLAPFWPQPGSGICSRLYRDLIPPSDLFEDVHRFEYRPTHEHSNERENSPWAMRMSVKVRDLEALARSWSAVHRWQEANPTRKPQQEQSARTTGSGDIVDMLFDEIRQVDNSWANLDKDVMVELPTGLLLARKK